MGAPQYEQAGADIGGTGTTNTIPRWTGPSTLGDSVITQSGSFIGIGLGAAAPLATVHTLNAVGAIGASPNWMSSFDTSGNYRSGLAFAFSVTPAASKVAVQVSSNGTGGVVNAIVAQGDGSVGIGTASPSTRLHVSDNSSIPVIVQSSGSTDSYLRFINTSNNLGYIGYVGTNLYLAPNNGAGNVGIGTASPAAKLHASFADATVGTLLSGATKAVRFVATATQMSIDGIDNTGLAGFQQLQINGLPLLLATAGVERARIDSAGRWLVGTTGTPTSAQVKVVVAGAGNGGQEWAASAGGGLAIIPETAGTGSFFTFTGNVGAESYTQSFKAISTGLDVSTSGYGVKLQGTGGTNNTDPNVLDFYADGGTANSGGVTWTPTLAFGGNSTGITYTTQVGRYTRIGNTIVAHAYIKISSKGTSTGDATIGGLPTSSNTTGVYPSAAIGFTASITFANQMFARMNPNSTSVFLTETTGAGTVSALNDTDFNNSSEIAFTICYPVT